MRPPRRDDNLETLLAAGAVAAGLALAILTVRLAGAPPTALDRRVRRRVLSAGTGERRRLALMIGSPGYPGIYFPATAVLIHQLRRHGARGGEALAIASIGGWATHRFIKLFANRRRPRTMRGRGNEFEAFPSGHTAATTAIALTASYLFARQRLMPLPAALAIGALVPVTIGATRIISDEHWTTDVVGGWIAGAGMAALAALAFERR
jgi:undecaprenyl-diphosphatase